MVAPYGCFFERSVHAFDLAVCPGMIDLGQSVLDTVFGAHAIEDMGAGMAILLLLGAISYRRRLNLGMAGR